MKKPSTIILMSLALFLLGCGNTDSRDTEAYDFGYEEGAKEGYKEGYSDAYKEIDSEYIREQYKIDQIYDFADIHDYVIDNCVIEDFYEDDELVEYLESQGYVVVSEDQYNALKEKKELFYIGNMHSHVFHRPDCNSVSKINNSNIKKASRDEFINSGYSPCGNCNP